MFFTMKQRLIAFAVFCLVGCGGIYLTRDAIAQAALSFAGQMQNGTSAAPVISGSDRAVGVAFGSSKRLTLSGHIHAGGVATATLPVLSSCGTSPALATGSNDFAGTFTTGSGATTCTLTFGTAFAAAPACLIKAQVATQPTYSTSASAITGATTIASTAYDYVCIGKNVN